MGKSNEVSRRRFVASALSTAALAALPARLKADAKTQKIGGNEMTTLTPYLLFDGSCQKAMEFYKSCFGGELTAAKVKDSPAKDSMPAAQQEKVLNARPEAAIWRFRRRTGYGLTELQFAATPFVFI